MSKISDSPKNKYPEREEWLLFLKWARDFRRNRLKEIEKGGVWDSRFPGAHCILHWMAMPSEGQKPVDIEFVSKSAYKDFIAFGKKHHAKCYKNSDGLLIKTDFLEGSEEWLERFDGERQYLQGFQYTQIFRSGAVEAVYVPPTQRRKGKETNYISLYAFEFFRRQIKNCMKRIFDLRFSSAVIIGISILGVKDYSIYTPIISARYLVQLPQKIPDDADEVLNSAESDIKLVMRIENIQDIENIDEQILQPIFDLLWRDFGFFECDRNFQNGSWELQQ